MVGQDRGFFALIEEKIGHPVIKYHCIIYQENLCAKIPNSNFASVIATTTKIVNFIVTRSATTVVDIRVIFALKLLICHVSFLLATRWRNSSLS